MRYDKQIRAKERLEERLAASLEKEVALREELEKTKVILNGTMHEIRRFSGELSKHCEDLHRLATKNSNVSVGNLAQTALHTSGMISARLAYTDIELNPAAIRKQVPLRSGIYKKFEKAKYILGRAASDKRVKVKFVGSSHSEIDAIQAFDLIPFVLLDNAIKYSPSDQEITVLFEDGSGQKFGSVIVSSIGPQLRQEEKERIFLQGYRGSNVIRLSGHGDGLGLPLARKLCGFHDIAINAFPGSDVHFHLENIPYADFRIEMKWQKL